MRGRFLVTLGALVAYLFLVTPPPSLEAQTTPKYCKKICQIQKKVCQKSFENQFRVAKAVCQGFSGPDRKDCKKAARQFFQWNSTLCAEGPEGFKTCRTCCKVNTESCTVAVCGDGQQLGAERCDNGAANSNAAPDACRTDCALPTCGDGVRDTGEACDDGAANSDTAPDACRTDCAVPTCGDNVLDANEECERNSDNACPRACHSDCRCPACPVNLAGGPNRLTLTVGGNADLDTGVSGISHNQGVTVGSQTFVCLQGCDLSTNPVCTGTGETNAGGKTGTINGDTFGAPLPLLSGGVPVCVINEYRDDVTLDTLDLATGELSMKVRLLSKVYQTSPVEPAPCPNCKVSGAPAIGVAGKCERGPNHGKACTINGLTSFGPTSKDCPPPGANNVGNLEIDLDLTTGSVNLPIDGFEGGQSCLGPPAGNGGSCPCPGQKQRNQCANENQCSAAQCPSGLEPGVDQLCCQGGSGVKLGCYPGQGATETDIIRAGIASIVYADPANTTGAWPDPTYPKMTAQDGSLVSTFCIAATTSNIVNNVAGLPGPGAVILPGPMVVELSKCSGGTNDGQPCGSDPMLGCPGGKCK